MTELERAVERSRRIAPTTKRLYLPRVRRFVEHAGASPSKWTRAAVLSWIEALEDEGMSAQMINNYVMALRFASKWWAARHGREDFAGGRDVLLPTRRPAPRQTALNEDECRRLVGTANPPQSPYDLRDRAILLLMIYAGLRREAVVGVEIGSLRKRRREDGTHVLHLTYTTKERHADTKTERRASLTKQPRKALLAWLAWMRDQGIREGKLFRSLTMTVSGWKVADRMSAAALYRMIKLRGERAEVEVSPHALRHTFASLAIARGVDIARLKDEMGHQSLTTTMGYIQSLSDDPIGDEFPDLLDEDDE